MPLQIFKHGHLFNIFSRAKSCASALLPRSFRNSERLPSCPDRPERAFSSYCTAPAQGFRRCISLQSTKVSALGHINVVFAVLLICTRWFHLCDAAQIFNFTRFSLKTLSNFTVLRSERWRRETYQNIVSFCFQKCFSLLSLRDFADDLVESSATVCSDKKNRLFVQRVNTGTLTDIII